jgi:CheY-like chemotaxis protein
MLRLVTTNNIEVFRHLGSPAFQRLGLTHEVASSYDEALSKIRDIKPEIAIIDAEIAGGTGYDLCRTVKEDDGLRGIHVSLLLSSMITRENLDRLAGSGCDDVLALPLHTDDFYHHIAQIAGLPFRRERRVGVELEVSVPGSGEPIQGMVLNVSANGVGVQLPSNLEIGQLLHVRLHHDGKTYEDAPGTVAWVKPADVDGETLAGISLGNDIPIATRVLLEELALYDVSPANVEDPSGGGVTVALQGDFTEVTSFDSLAARLEGEDNIDFNAAAVRYISSAGVRTWCQFLELLRGKTYSFRHCSMAFASQAAMVPMVIGDGVVLSLEAPYFCETCDREDVRLLETRALLREGRHIVPPQLSCSTCGGPLEFDDVPDRYFAFLREES